MRSQPRVWKILEGEPEFIISVADTQNTLAMNVDLVASTKLSMIQAFNQEMSLVVKEFGGFILKYMGDAVLAFCLVPSHQSQPKEACTRAINCARCMLQVAREGINPILNSMTVL